MKSERHRPESEGTKKTKRKTTEKRRKHRARPTPRWLVGKKDLDEIAQRRCLLVLEVLSGARPVTDAIVEAKISRQTYYKLEERALRAMLTALSPGVGVEGTETGALEAAQAKAAMLEEKVATLEKEKRRTERLSLAMKKLVRPGPLVTGLGTPRGRRRRTASTSDGPKSSRTSSPTTTESTTAESSSAAETTSTVATAGVR
jgi:hypothetical protein